MSRHGARLTAALASLALAASLLLGGAGSALAANTRIVYFGSADCAASCPPQTNPANSPQFWSALNPYGTDLGYDSTTGMFYAGQDSFSPVTTGGSTATDIVLSNASMSTMTQVQVNGGKAAPTTINTSSVPEMPYPYDPNFFNLDGTVNPLLPSLPTGLYYRAVYVITNPNGIGVKCSLTQSTTTLAKGYYDGLHCAVGNLGALQGVTLRVIVTDVSAGAGTTEPWFELGLKEGSSTTGSNSDAFFTYGMLTVGAQTCDTTSSFSLDGQPVSLSNAGLGLTNCVQTTGVVTGHGFSNGTLAVVGTNKDVDPCANLFGFTCFGYASTAAIEGCSSPLTPCGVTWTVVWSAVQVPSGGPKGAIHFLDDGTYQQIHFKHQYLCGTTITTFCWSKLVQDKTTGNWMAIFESPTNGSLKGF
jgi:hypothetical protein